MTDPKDGRPPRTNPRLSPTSVDHITHGIDRPRVPRRAFVALLVVAVLVAAGVALATRGHEERATAADPDTAAARALLLDLADRSDDQPAVITDALPILHESRDGTGTTTVYVSDDKRRQQAAVLLVTNRTDRWWLTPNRVRNLDRQIGERQPLNDVATRYLAGQIPTPEFVFRGISVERDASMPAPPDDGIEGERTRVSQTVPDDRSEGRLFESLVDQLEAAHADNHLRAGWLRLLANVDGLRVVPDQTDRLGRTGVGVLFTSHDQNTIDRLVILDPTTGALLGTRETVLSTDQDEGLSLPTVEADHAFTAEAVAEAPAPDLTE